MKVNPVINGEAFGEIEVHADLVEKAVARGVAEWLKDASAGALKKGGVEAQKAARAACAARIVSGAYSAGSGGGRAPSVVTHAFAVIRANIKNAKQRKEFDEIPTREPASLDRAVAFFQRYRGGSVKDAQGMRVLRNAVMAAAQKRIDRIKEAREAGEIV